MFSQGHLLWISICFVLIVVNLIFNSKLKISTRKMLTICLIVGVGSEILKFVTSMQIIPMVRPDIVVSGNSGTLNYIPTGQYSPYLEVSHLPFELCSLMNVFIAIALLLKDEKRREKLLTFMYISGLIGGTLGIVLAYVTGDCHCFADYFTSIRVWQFFLYHAMIVTLGIYLGFIRKNQISIKSLITVLAILICLDVPTFYINSIFSEPVYVDEKPIGLLYRANFFSSYVNPLGLALPHKWQWLLYLVIRAAIAVLLISILLCLPEFKRRINRSTR